MVKVFFDTNVIIDALTLREGSENSLLLFKMVLFEKIKGYLTAKQITDIYYSTRKVIPSEEDRIKLIKILCTNFEVLPTLVSDIKYSCDNMNGFKDFEDRLIDEVASINCVNYLVTKNCKDFEKSKNNIVSPEEFIKIYKAINNK